MTAPARPVLATVFAHLVLWPGLVVVAFTYRPVVRLYFDHLAGVPVDVANAVVGAYEVLPVAVALVIAARGRTLRLVAALGAVALLVGVGVLNVVVLAGPSHLFPAALTLLAFGTWVVVRRPARLGYLVLVPAAALADLWYAPTGDGLRSFPYVHGVDTTGLLLLWNDLPVVALAVLGLVASLLRPRPAPDRDATGLLVVGGLALLAALAGVVSAVA